MKNIALLLIVGYLIVVLSMYLLQRRMMYFPSTAPANAANAVINIESAGNTIKVITDNSHLEPAVIYFGGNGEDAYSGADRMHQAFLNNAAYYVNYPGYGGSTGSPNETSITQAARDVYKYVSAKHRSVAVVGRSLGTGVAIKLASEETVSHLILISPYDSITNVATEHYPFFPKWLIKDKFDSLSRVENIRVSTLIILAKDDEVIPIKHSNKLINAFKSTAPIARIYNAANHNNLHLKEGFMPMIRDFLNE